MVDSILLPKNRFLWMLLALQGGFVNVGGLLTIHLFVSHVTGFSAHFSESLTQGNFIRSLYFILVPAFFLIGAIFSSLFTEANKFQSKSPRYLIIMMTLAFIYLFVALGGYLGLFGKFGEPFSSFRDFTLLALLSFSCGGQNALFTHYSKSIIRTTHLTGITTDLGIGISKYFISRDEQVGKYNRIRIELIVFFVIGSVLGSLLFPRFEFLAFLFPFFNCLFIGHKLSLKVPDTF